MEILSTGEKIKRARVYKGATLKDICEDKISVSKMSCIENNKVKPEHWILEMVAEKLDIDINYLLKDVENQIKDNIAEIENKEFSNDLEEKIFYNLEYALEYKEYNLAFELMHILFHNYLINKSYENIQVNISRYYDICQKSEVTSNILVYFKDMGRYFFANCEYAQAATYFKNIIKLIRENKIEDRNEEAIAVYNKAICHTYLNEFDKTYLLLDDLIKIVGNVNEKSKKAIIYNFIADMQLKRGANDADEYEKIAYSLYDSSKDKIDALINSSLILIEIGKIETSLKYMNNAIKLCKDNGEEGLVEVLLICVENLLNNNLIEEAHKICDDALNHAIASNDVQYIERAYYLRSKILQGQDKCIESEMYMNLSLDALMKFGGKKEIYERYLDMGNMYFKLGEIRDSLKYFNLAINIEKKI